MKTIAVELGEAQEMDRTTTIVSKAVMEGMVVVPVVRLLLWGMASMVSMRERCVQMRRNECCIMAWQLEDREEEEEAVVVIQEDMATPRLRRAGISTSSIEGRHHRTTTMGGIHHRGNILISQVHLLRLRAGEARRNLVGSSNSSMQLRNMLGTSTRHGTVDTLRLCRTISGSSTSPLVAGEAEVEGLQGIAVAISSLMTVDKDEEDRLRSSNRGTRGGIHTRRCRETGARCEADLLEVLSEGSWKKKRVTK